MFKLWATIIKDVRILFRDKAGLILMFGMPILLVIIVTGIQNSTFQLVKNEKLKVLVCNLDTGKAGQEFTQAIDNIGMFKLLPAKKGLNEQQLTERMRVQDAMLAVIIPGNFSVKVNAKAGNAASKALKSFGLEGDSVKAAPTVDPLTLFYNPVLQESLRLSVQGAMQSGLQLVESRQTLRKLYLAINDKPLPAQLENEMLNNRTVINQVPVLRNGSRTVPNASQHNVPAWTIFAMFFITISLGGSVVREKLNGSFIRLKTLPTNYTLSLISKQLVYLGVTLLQALVIFAIGVWLFPVIGLPKLNLPADISGLVIVTLLCGWCAVSYAICIGTFAHTLEQANGFGAVSIVILAAIGGLMVPSFAMPGAFRTIMNFSPLHWCLEAYYGLFLEGGKLTDVWQNIVPLLVITLLIQLITYTGLKRKHLI
ncbi:ABC transporter permease [Mucilaginibacter koreensis]